MCGEVTGETFGEVKNQASSVRSSSSCLGLVENRTKTRHKNNPGSSNDPNKMTRSQKHLSLSPSVAPNAERPGVGREMRGAEAEGPRGERNHRVKGK